MSGAALSKAHANFAWQDLTSYQVLSLTPVLTLKEVDVGTIRCQCLGQDNFRHADERRSLSGCNFRRQGFRRVPLSLLDVAISIRLQRRTPS